MEIWQCVLWLSAVTLHIARSQPPDQEGRIREALHLYNQKEDGEFFFKLLPDLPATLLQEGEESPAFTFLIKETDCHKSEAIDLDQCEYKKDGEVMFCRLYQKEEVTSEILKCVSLTKVSRVKRSSGKKNCKTQRCRVGGLTLIGRPGKDSSNSFTSV